MIELEAKLKLPGSRIFSFLDDWVKLAAIDWTNKKITIEGQLSVKQVDGDIETTIVRRDFGFDEVKEIRCRK